MLEICDSSLMNYSFSWCGKKIEDNWNMKAQYSFNVFDQPAVYEKRFKILTRISASRCKINW